MNDYFPQEQSIASRMGETVKPVLHTIAYRFLSDHPPLPAVYHLRSKANFHISEDYMDEILLHEKFPDMKPESYVYAWAQLTPAQEGPFHFRFRAFGPVAIYVNGELSYRTSQAQERFSDQVSDVCLNLREGANSLMFRCICTPLGCGFCIGSSSYKGRRIQFFGPSSEHRGMSGFIYSEPMEQPLEIIPGLGCEEAAAGVSWYPRIAWSLEEKQQSLSRRLYGKEGKEVLAAAAIDCPYSGYYQVVLEDEAAARVYLDGVLIKDSDPVYLSGDRHILAVRGQKTGVVVTCLSGSASQPGSAGLQILPECPVLAEGEGDVTWLYLGPFEQEDRIDLTSALTFRNPVMVGGTETFWCADMPEMVLRPFNEAALYGEWNYPLGVTLYGMIQAARLLEDSSIGGYVEGHMRKCAGFYDYCLWDKKTYGAAPFHNQLTTIDSLDDCGSFASAMLEVMKDHEVPVGRRISDRVAAYMRHDQQRLPDGTFYRNHSYLPVMNETMWADDLYMSIPFLCRYYELSEDTAYLEDAVRQVKQFFSYLFLPELQILSHIYDTHHQVQTKVPWGRGNGWALFSISELLTVLPEDHPERGEILRIFRELCKGYLKLQGEKGMWHQVLTYPHSYQETSCTAMFIYGFARGVRYGWLEDRDTYGQSARKAWGALCRTAIDWRGNLYGVCRGSGYSFSKEYYANDLGWNMNDTHGIGIVLLAGIEVEKMRTGEDQKRKNGSERRKAGA